MIYVDNAATAQIDKKALDGTVKYSLSLVKQLHFCLFYLYQNVH